MGSIFIVNKINHKQTYSSDSFILIKLLSTIHSALVVNVKGENSTLEWRVASGEWRVASGEWRVASGEDSLVMHSPLSYLKLHYFLY